MGAHAAPACRNCGAPAGGNFCPECGQDTKAHPPTAREFLHEFAQHYVAIEGSLWTTLKKLAVPGALTLEYLAGRKRRYIHPLRLYLTASVVFFLVAKLVPPVQAFEPRAVMISESGTAVHVAALHCDEGDTLCKEIERRFREHFGGMTRAQAAEQVSHWLVTVFPYVMFVLVPAFALLTRAAYWNRPYNYGEHLVFALHVHAAVFFMGAIVEPLRVSILWTVPSAMYVFAALARVFGGRKIPMILRSTLVFLAYFAMLVAAILAIITVSALS